MNIYDNMKTVAKKMKIFFSSKGCKAERDFSDKGEDAANMTSRPKCRDTVRNQRKLPAIPSPHSYCPQRMCTPTYRYAINWLNKNKDTLDLAFDLLEIHPKVLGHEACTKLRTFMSQSANNNSDFERMFKDSSKSDKHNHLHLPEILVSHAHDDLVASRAKQKQHQKPMLRVCGNVEADKWQRLIVNLSCKYSVNCVTSDADAVNQSYDDVDVLVFLLDSMSFESETCRQELRDAYTCETSVVFVRDMEFELFDNFPKLSSKLFHNSDQYLAFESYIRGNDTGSMGRSCMSSPSPCFLHSTGLLSTGKNGCSYKNGSRSIDSGLGRNSNVSSNASSPTKSHNLLDINGRISSIEHEPTRVMTDDERIHISKILNAEYGMALTYHSLYHDTCSKRIRTVVDSKLSVNPTDDSKLFPSPSKPLSMCSSNDSAVSDIHISLSPEPEEFVLKSEQELPPKRRKSVTFVDEIPSRVRKGSTASETVFLLSNPLQEESPIVVRWHNEMPKESISNSPSVDSFGFQEVDLSKRVNELDLFTDSEYSSE